MNFVVAGVVSVLALAVAATSWIFAPIYQAKVETAGTKPAAPIPAPASLDYLKSLSKTNWIIFAFLATLCGMATWGVWNGGASVVTQIKYIVVLLFLISSACFDYRTHLIPNFLIVAMLLSGVALLGVVFFLDRTSFAAGILSAGGGLLFCFPVFYVLSILTHNGLGMGDVKLISATAWLLGLTVTLFSVLFGLILCALIAIGLMLTKRKSKTDFIPFGPFFFGGYVLLLLLFRV